MNGFDPALVVDATRKALDGRLQAALHAPPPLTRQDREQLGDMIGYAPVGYAHVGDFESLMEDRLGRKHAIAVSSGTAALHLALLALDAGGRWTRVAVPALTFAAAAAAVRYCGADPIFYPFHHRQRTETAYLRIFIDVELLGIPNEAGLNASNLQVEGYSLIEDAAQALGSVERGKPCGSFGDVSILSFNNNKIVTTGGGGMVLTDRDDIAERVRFLATTAKVPSPHHYVHSEVGFNYRMPNACAALGLVMLSKLDRTLDLKARLHEAYRTEFSDMPGVTLIEAPEGVIWNHWLNAIEVPAGQRDATLQALTAAGYECRALYTPLPQLEPYKQFARGLTFPEADRRFDVTICLPSGPELAS